MITEETLHKRIQQLRLAGISDEEIAQIIEPSVNYLNEEHVRKEQDARGHTAQG